MSAVALDRYQSLPSKTNAKYGYLDNVPYLSPSSVRSYRSCPLCWKRKYIDREPTADKEVLIVGGSVHTAIEHGRFRILDFGPEHYHEHREEILERVVEAGLQDFDARINKPQDNLEIRWTKRGGGPAAARERVARILRGVAPTLLDRDVELGLDGVEQRVWGLGLPLDEDEKAWYQETGTEPIFPNFGVMAICDSHYASGWMKDTKTKGKSEPPSYFDQVQLALYDLPWWRAGVASELGVDVIVTTESPTLNPWRVVVSDEFRSEVIDMFNWAAEHILAQDFPPNPGPLCNYLHESTTLQLMREA